MKFIGYGARSKSWIVPSTKVSVPNPGRLQACGDVYILRLAHHANQTGTTSPTPHSHPESLQCRLLSKIRQLVSSYTWMQRKRSKSSPSCLLRNKELNWLFFRLGNTGEAASLLIDGRFSDDQDPMRPTP